MPRLKKWVWIVGTWEYEARLIRIFGRRRTARLPFTRSTIIGELALHIQTTYLSFFIPKCTFWAQFFSTRKRVNCGKISKNFPKFLKTSQNFPIFLQNFSTWQFFLHQYNSWYSWQIWALRTRPEEVPGFVSNSGLETTSTSTCFSRLNSCTCWSLACFLLPVPQYLEYYNVVSVEVPGISIIFGQRETSRPNPLSDRFSCEVSIPFIVIKNVKNSTDRKFTQGNSTEAILQNWPQNSVKYILKSMLHHPLSLKGVYSFIIIINFSSKMQKNSSCVQTGKK